MHLNVIGAGFGRTGTTSLKSALEYLGFGPCYHMYALIQNPEHAPVWEAARQGEPVNWDLILSGYQSTLDWPACYFWERLWQANPGSKVILSVRDADSWYNSMTSTLYPAMTRNPDDTGPIINLARDIVLHDTFSGQFLNRAKTIGVFNDHIKDVTSKVPADDLLVYEAAQGWGPLCEFLGVDVPGAPFPHKNTRAEYREKRQISETESSA